MRRFQFRQDRGFQRGSTQTFSFHGSKNVYGLLIRYRDEERLRRGWLGRGGVARLILVRLKSHRVRVDDLSLGCHDLPRCLSFHITILQKVILR